MEAHPFPEVLGPYSTVDGGSWTAEFDSFNARLDDIYYLVTRNDAEGTRWCFFVKTSVMGPGDLEEKLRARITPHAEEGGRNTDYTGNMVKWLPARKAEARARAGREAARAANAAGEG